MDSEKLSKYETWSFEFDERVIRCLHIPITELKDSGYPFSEQAVPFAENAQEAWLKRTEPDPNATSSELKLVEFLRAFEPTFLDTQDRDHWLVLQSKIDSGFQRQWFSVDLRHPRHDRAAIRHFLEKSGFLSIADEFSRVAHLLSGVYEVAPPAECGGFLDFVDDPKWLRYFESREFDLVNASHLDAPGEFESDRVPHVFWYWSGDEMMSLVVDTRGRLGWRPMTSPGFAHSFPAFANIGTFVERWIDFRKHAPADESYSFYCTTLRDDAER